ncbi:MAG: 4Fe-4S binding domain, partial [Firmicutes bacterium]|nr:4Fe-4S binding domain [Bacillota bacterium]
MIRKIIQIEEDKCNGCGLCVTACHEGAIGMIDGKAKLLREDYCDGFGDCLPACPTGAITFVEREADAYDEAAVQVHLTNTRSAKASSGSCPGVRAASFTRPSDELMGQPVAREVESQLRQWPIQIKLAPLRAPYFEGANLLIAADCAAYAYGDFHSRYMKNKVTLIGCPKLDNIDYAEKLTAIIEQNYIKSVTVVRMEVPC